MAGATGVLLPPGLGAAAGDLASHLDLVGALPGVELVHDHGLVDEVGVKGSAEEGIADGHFAHHAALDILQLKFHLCVLGGLAAFLRFLDHEEALGSAGDAALDHDEVAVRVDVDHFQILDGDSGVAHVAGHLSCP